MAAKRVKLSAIQSLTFYDGEWTTGRRTEPIQQLECEGRPCRRYKPDVVRCVNAGGSGANVEWTCTADLPEKLRLGRVQVGCEGWSKPGDEYVLEGSCSLKYRLVQLPGESNPNRHKDWLGDDVASVIFGLIWFAVLFFIVASFAKSCFRTRQYGPGNGPINRPGQGPNIPGGYGSGDAPPPYSAGPPPPGSGKAVPGQEAQNGWRPGFWTGVGLAGLGAHLWNNVNTRSQAEYDWERERERERWGSQRRTSYRTGHQNHHHQHQHDSYDRGEGSSGLGQMRSSTGFGGSNVR